MKKYFGTDFRRVHHAIKVARFKEGLNRGPYKGSIGEAPLYVNDEFRDLADMAASRPDPGSSITIA